jgi:phospholipid-translocating ATPase
LAYRVLEPAEYEAWANAYHEAEVALSDREQKMEDVMAQVETNLQLLGATAIEDKLQDGVPECIADLKRAGINIWVATGDKLETAVAIGYTTNLLTADSNLIIVREGNHSIHDQLRDSLGGFFGDDLRRSTSLTQLDTRASTQLRRVNTGVQSLVGDDNGQRPGGFSLVIEGSALTEVFKDDSGECEDLLIQLALKCNTVICCRVSPLQKAQIVRLIKDNLGVLCLAIGDGANDVSMIQAADVGVGISGEEGLQAVNSADYATGQFRFLKRLLLVHGHWSYFRNGTMIVNFFYKNIIGIGILFWYMFFCGWSTTFVYAYVYLLFWNVFWTLCPVIAIGVFERNAEDVDLMALPELYRYSREHRYYNWPRFLYYLFEGVYQTAVGYFFIHYAYVSTTTRGDGWDIYKDEMSTTMAVAAVMYANLFSGLNIDAWSWWVVFAVWVGPFLIWVFTPIYSVVPPTTYISGVYGNDIFLFRSAAFWFGWPFVTIIALMPRYLIKFAKQNIWPNDIDTMRLVRKYNPDVDPFTHPMLGGRLDHAHDNDHMSIGRVQSNAAMASRNSIALEELTGPTEYTPATEYPPRQSTE